MWMNRLSGPMPDVAVAARCRRRASSRIGRMPNGERMCAAIWRSSCAPDLPGLVGRRIAKIDLAAHDHVNELVARGEPLLLDARRVVRILVAGIGAEDVGTRALEIAEGGAAPGIEQGLDGGVRVLRRVMDLRDVVHRRDAVVELRQAAEQLADVHVLRTVHGREREQDVFEIVGIRARPSPSRR